MKWIRYARGVILGVAMVVISLDEGGFATPRQTLATVLFIVVGIALAALVVWYAFRDYRRFQREKRLAATPVPEAPDAGIGFLRREQAAGEQA